MTRLSQILSHYYTYLEGHLDADSVSHMMYCQRLISDNDYDVITSAPNDIKMNCLILQYVKMMDAYKFQQFCDILKDMESQQQIGKFLETCKCFKLMYIHVWHQDMHTYSLRLLTSVT